MAVLKMQRISICALKKDRKAILEKLQSMGEKIQLFRHPDISIHIRLPNCCFLFIFGKGHRKNVIQAKNMTFHDTIHKFST